MLRRREKPVYAPKPRYSTGGPLTDWERHLERGLDLLKQGRLDEALADLDEAIHINRRNGELFAARGLILAEMKRYNDALSDLDMALKLDARQWVAHYAKGLVAYRQQHYDEAAQHLSIAQRFSPMRPEIFFTRAAVYYESGDIKKAALDLDNVLQTTESNDKRHKEAKKLLSRVQKEK